jgi:transcriptional regulator with XRE-family HTH domain
MHRRRLRNELRTARQDKGLTQDQVARAMEWSLSKMNRIEKAKTGISANDLKVLLPLYGIIDRERTEELLALARAARQTPWWRGYGDVAPTTLLELIDYESAATSISQFEPMVVPGILQTEEYALAVLRNSYGEGSPAERLADLRTRRRDLLTSEGAPTFSFVLDESVIRRLVGSAGVMTRQLMHLVTLGDLPNVTIRLVPFTVGLYPGTKGPFKVIEFDDEPDEDVVFLEGPRGDFISDDPEETAIYRETFSRITQQALGESESVGLLRKAAGEVALSAENAVWVTAGPNVRFDLQCTPMADVEKPRLAWRKSSASQESDCAEIAIVDGSVLVRDSARRDGVVLTFPPAAWSAFVARHRALPRSGTRRWPGPSAAGSGRTPG